jgi:hypothetical protein
MFQQSNFWGGGELFWMKAISSQGFGRGQMLSQKLQDGQRRCCTAEPEINSTENPKKMFTIVVELSGNRPTKKKCAKPGLKGSQPKSEIFGLWAPTLLAAKAKRPIS